MVSLRYSYVATLAYKNNANNVNNKRPTYMYVLKGILKSDLALRLEWRLIAMHVFCISFGRVGTSNSYIATCDSLKK